MSFAIRAIRSIVFGAIAWALTAPAFAQTPTPAKRHPRDIVRGKPARPAPPGREFRTRPTEPRTRPVKLPPLVRQATPAWSALMPKDWNIQTSAWAFVSPNGNQILRVRLGRDTGGSLDALAMASVERFAERALKLKVVSKTVVKTAGRDMVTLLLDSWMVRKQKLHQYLTMRMMLRLPKRATIITVSFSASGERMATFLPLAEKVIGSLDFGAGGAR
jgi:hypothetical protein